MTSDTNKVKASTRTAQGGVAKDLLAGTVAGWAQVFVGQPFDIVKVRLQSSTLHNSALDAAKTILTKEGPAAFYKGTVMPLVGIGACVSLQFAGLQGGKRFFVERNTKSNDPNPTHLSLTQLFLSGAFAGILNSVASGPVEHIRIRLQTQTDNRYKGPLDALGKIYKTDGLKGIYQGQVATLAREGLGYGFYFLAYEYLVQREMARLRIARDELPMTTAALYGATAGYAMWLTNYPLDVIKSRMQTDNLPSQGRKYSSPIDCARQLLAEQGPKGFVRGLVPTLFRSPFVNASTFVVFEVTMRFLNGQ
ncbi:MC family mitochondrial carrier protein [Meredithblackwellia eburnea MCA 4105]